MSMIHVNSGFMVTIMVIIMVHDHFNPNRPCRVFRGLVLGLENHFLDPMSETSSNWRPQMGFSSGFISGGFQVVKLSFLNKMEAKFVHGKSI